MNKSSEQNNGQDQEEMEMEFDQANGETNMSEINIQNQNGSNFQNQNGSNFQQMIE